MAFSQKQQRDGTDLSVPVGHTPPSADLTGTVSGLMSSAQAVAASRINEAQNLMVSPAGSGVTGHMLGGGPNMWEWDDGLAIGEQAGEP